MCVGLRLKACPRAGLAWALCGGWAALLSAMILPMIASAQAPAPNPPAADLPRTLAQAPATTAQSLRVVVLLPLDNTQLKRAAGVVRDGIRAVFGTRKSDLIVSECPYGAEAAVQAYQRCVTAEPDWVIGPLGRSDVTALALAKLQLTRPTLMLSPLGTVPLQPMAVLSPDLESEADAIAQQASDDACRKPVLAEAAGTMSSRVSVAITAYWRERSVTPLPTVALPNRDGWRRAADKWRNDNVDCVLFTGSGAVLTELKPYLRGMAIYVTSASFETALDRIVDWTGVRIADAPWLVDAERPTFAPYASATALSPTLARLYALGLDAARLVIAAGRDTLPPSFEGAIGELTLKDAQYRRRPIIGEFRERDLVKVSP